MTKLEKAIDTAKTLSAEDLSEEELELLVTAASSWAALVWRKGTERPPHDRFLTVVALAPIDAPRRPILHEWAFWSNEAWWFQGKPMRVPAYWLDGSLPPLPEATDEG